MRGMRMDKWGIIMLFSFVLCSCGRPSGEHQEVVKDTVVDAKADYKRAEQDASLKIFGVSCKKDEHSVLMALENAGIIGVDTIEFENEHFRFAVVEFEGVKFGMNRGFNFITSQHDSKTIKALVNGISKFYGEPEIDGDEEEEPEYRYYLWNRLAEHPDDPYIRIRPVHSEEGGLTMKWNL